MDTGQADRRRVDAPVASRGGTVRGARHDHEEWRAPTTGIRLVMLGRPGSGKGTQSEAFAKMLGIKHIAIGDVLRAAVRAGSPLGNAARPYLSAGRLLPDAVIGELALQEIRAAGPSGFVLDGFPRTLAQATMLTTMILPAELDAAVNLVVRRRAVFLRLRRRWVCPECGLTTADEHDGTCPDCLASLCQRSDDTAETIARRLHVFDIEMEEVTTWYSRLGLLRVVNGHGSVDGVAQQVLRAVLPLPLAPWADDPSAVDRRPHASQGPTRMSSTRAPGGSRGLQEPRGKSSP